MITLKVLLFFNDETICREETRREAIQLEQAETDRRRNLTEDERLKEDKKSGKLNDKDKSEWKYLQKYHHKGAFYMDDSSIQEATDVRHREVSGATLEDKFDKEMMPSVMQVKNFGRAGRTKYTHLGDQDTSSRGDLWQQDEGYVPTYG